MAVLASNSNMPARQRKVASVVIEICWQPTFLGMTIRTEYAKTSLMRIILLVAGITILGRQLEVSQPACWGMTSITG
jgi:hypothetical protein